MPFQLTNLQFVILNELSKKEIHQHDIAITYSLALKSEECDNLDWGKINNAIIERWSRSGLERIKKQAWKMLAA